MVRRVLCVLFLRFERTTPIVNALIVSLGSFTLLCALEIVRASSDGRFARLYLSNRLLNGLIHFELNLVDSAPSIQFGLHDFICLEEVLQFLGKLEVLVGENVHVLIQRLNLSTHLFSDVL